MDIAEVMIEPRAKAERALSHIKTIAAMSKPLSRELYEITCTECRSTAILAKPDSFSYRYIPKRDVRSFFSLMLGDAVHNLRAALDYWAASLIREITKGPRNERIHFPFSKNWSDLTNTPGYKELMKHCPDAAIVIKDRIMPCGDKFSGKLWGINRLDNIDKHNFIIPVITVANVNGLNVPGFLTNCGVGNNAAREFGIIEMPSNLNLDPNYRIDVAMTFPDGDIFARQDVVETLQDLSALTAKTLDDLEVFLSGLP